eukprot:5235608-Prymnesium_polylepis.1
MCIRDRAGPEPPLPFCCGASELTCARPPPTCRCNPRASVLPACLPHAPGLPPPPPAERARPAFHAPQHARVDLDDPRLQLRRIPAADAEPH